MRLNSVVTNTIPPGVVGSPSPSLDEIQVLNPCNHIDMLKKRNESTMKLRIMKSPSLDKVLHANRTLDTLSTAEYWQSSFMALSDLSHSGI